MSRKRSLPRAAQVTPANGRTEMTRRVWATLIAATPAIAQVTSHIPPEGAPTASPSAATPEAKLEKANADVRQVKDRLSKIDLPMTIEPSFLFKP